MQSKSDAQLLREYVKHGSEPAFSEIVGRHTNLVYSAALRQSDSPDTAAEITQTVFIGLARGARTLSLRMAEDASLAGWLCRSARNISLNVRRDEFRRHSRERQAMKDLDPASETAPDWERLRPVLDESMSELGESDYDALVMRFFKNQDLRSIGRAFGVTDDTAQKRVSRALEKLREQFARRGVTITGGVLSAVISANAVQAAPAGLGAAIGTAASLAQPTVLLKPLVLRGITATLVVGVACLAVLWLNRVGRGTTAGAGRAASASSGAEANLVDAGDAARLALSQSNTEPTSAGSLRFRVVDSKTLAPVPNARLALEWTTDFPSRMTNITATDGQGTAVLSIERAPVPDWGSRIEVFRDGYVPKYVSWSERQGDALKDIPTDYTTQLIPAVDIGATVVNEAGEPVPGARVVFDVRGHSASLERERLTMAVSYHIEITDNQGRWHCNHVPEQFGMISFQVAHQDYSPTHFGSAALGATTNLGVAYLAEMDLRNETAIMPLKRGGVAAGVVVDESGNPIPGAKVTFDHHWEEPTANQLTGVDGRFRFTNIPARSEPVGLDLICNLSVQADGYAPADFEFKGSVPAAESSFTLSRGAILRGRVVDKSGAPISKATVQICSHSNVRRFEWMAFTDQDGRFEWLSAPPKPEFYVVDAAGYEPLPELKWTADSSEHLVTLNPGPPPARVSGTVVDEVTGKALDNFQVWMSFTENIHTGYGRPMKSPRPPRLKTVGKAGEYFFTNRDAVVSYSLEIRADGYTAAELTGRGPITNDSRFDFKLRPGSALTGEVRFPDGQPVVGATVMLTTDRTRGYMKLPGQFDLTLSGGTHVETDAQGRFSFLPVSGAKNILIFNPAGFALITTEELVASPIVTLPPWGRVEGILKIGNQPGADRIIDLTASTADPEKSSYSLFLETRTDSEGRFVFEGLPPSPLRIAHRLSFREGQLGQIPQTLRTELEVRSGQTTRILLGGTGSKVVGKLRLKGERKINWQTDVQTLTTKMIGAPSAPARSAFASPAEFGKAWHQYTDAQRAFLQSEAGRAAKRNQREYVLVFEKDGSFKIDDVVPGNYELKIRVSDLSAPARGAFFTPTYDLAGGLTKEITIPEASEGMEGEPFDLGELELN